MSSSSYSLPCRVGNWANETALQELRANELFEKTIQHKTTTHILQERHAATSAVDLPPPHDDGLLRYGDVVMLSSAVGGVVAANEVRRHDHDAELCQLARTAAPLVAPQKRTCWTITPAGASPPSSDNLLRHHKPFYLVAHSAGPEPLHLMGERYTLTNAAYSESVRGGERKNLAAATTAPGSRRALWEVAFLDPRREAMAVLEPELAPVPANAFVALRNVMTQEHISTA